MNKTLNIMWILINNTKNFFHMYTAHMNTYMNVYTCTCKGEPDVIETGMKFQSSEVSGGRGLGCPGSV